LFLPFILSFSPFFYLPFSSSYQNYGIVHQFTDEALRFLPLIAVSPYPLSSPYIVEDNEHRGSLIR
jgi:hypothetical protein